MQDRFETMFSELPFTFDAPPKSATFKNSKMFLKGGGWEKLFRASYAWKAFRGSYAAKLFRASYAWKAFRGSYAAKLLSKSFSPQDFSFFLRPAALLFALGGLLFMAAGAWAGELKAAGVCEKQVGKITAKAADNPVRPLVKGGAVYVEDVVFSGDDGKAKIVFEDDSILEIGPSSEIKIVNFAFDATNPTVSKQVVTFFKGLCRFATGKLVAQKSENLTLQTPMAVIGIRGTTTDHFIESEKKEKDGKTDWVVESELHALRESKTKTEVSVLSQGQKVSLTQIDMAADVKPKQPPKARALTSFEKQMFAVTPIDPASFDPIINKSLKSGQGRGM